MPLACCLLPAAAAAAAAAHGPLQPQEPVCRIARPCIDRRDRRGDAVSHFHAWQGQRLDAAPANAACSRLPGLPRTDRGSTSAAGGRIVVQQPSGRPAAAAPTGGTRQRQPQHSLLQAAAAAAAGLRHGWRQRTGQRQDQGPVCVLGQHLQVGGRRWHRACVPAGCAPPPPTPAPLFRLPAFARPAGAPRPRPSSSLVCAAHFPALWTTLLLRMLLHGSTVRWLVHSSAPRLRFCRAVVEREGVAHQFEIDSCGTGGGSRNWYLPGGFRWGPGAVLLLRGLCLLQVAPAGQGSAVPRSLV